MSKTTSSSPGAATQVEGGVVVVNFERSIPPRAATTATGQLMVPSRMAIMSAVNRGGQENQAVAPQARQNEQELLG